jgi:hypothetical protein
VAFYIATSDRQLLLRGQEKSPAAEPGGPEMREGTAKQQLTQLKAAPATTIWYDKIISSAKNG